MKSRKGEYYIACRKNGEIYLDKKTGYILDDGKKPVRNVPRGRWTVQDH